MIHQEVLDFIKHFELGKDCFLYGCCYWFAYILMERFHWYYDCEYMYNIEENHFAIDIDGVLYDASGTISSDGFIPWYQVAKIDSLLYQQLIADCIDFVSVKRKER